MVFASNRNESFGGFDLFVTRRESDSWTEPENIGNKINTARDELFPFLDSENNLFFSSNGHRGLGGYDLFVCKINRDGWDEPMNLTKEINSPNDEIALTIDPSDGKTAYYTTRGQLGRQSLKLNRITLANQDAIDTYLNVSNALDFVASVEAFPGEQGALIASFPRQTNKISREQGKVSETPAKSGKNPVIQEPTKPQRQIKSVSKEAVDTAHVITMVREEPEKKPDTKSMNKPAQQSKSAVTKPVIAEKPATETINKTGKVVYRVQFSSSRTARGSFDITFGGNSFKTFEYSYNGMFRSCVGEFGAPGQASSLQKIVQKEGFPDAFVAAFRDNVRSLDPSLFK